MWRVGTTRKYRNSSLEFHILFDLFLASDVATIKKHRIFKLQTIPRKTNTSLETSGILGEGSIFLR